MHITKLQATGLKGLTFSHDLTPRVIITGPNYSGKTARLDAIRLALVGHLSELGKTKAATLGLASAGRLVVGLEMDGGMAVGRIFQQDAPENLTTTDPELLDKIAATPLLNQGHYFGLSDAAKIDYIFANSQPPAEFTKERILADLRAIKLEQETEQTEAARAAIFKEVAEMLEKEAVNEALTKLTEKAGSLKTAFTKHSAKAKETVGAMRTMTELKSREEECSAETLAEIESELTEARATLATAQQAYGSATATTAAAAKAEQRRTALTAATSKPVETHAAEINEKTILINTLREEIEKDEKQWEGDMEHYRIIAATAIEHAHETRRIYEKHAEAAREAKEAIDALNEMKECPHCHSKGKGWKKALLATLTETLDKNASESERLAAVVEEEEKEAQSASDALDGRTASWQRCENARRRIRGLETEIATLQQNARHAAETRKAQEEELATLTVPASFDSDLLESARLEADRCSAVVNELEARRKTALKLQQDLIRESQAAEENQKAEAFVTVIKAYGKHLADLKGKLVERTFAVLLTIANEILGTALLSPLAYHENTLGRWANQQFITHETFTGAEKAITYIALSAALSSKAPFRLVLLDEVSRLDEEKLMAVMGLLDDAILRGEIDQVILAQPTTHSDLPNISSDWQHIAL